MARGPPGLGALPPHAPMAAVWVQECLLPVVYWANQVARTRCTRRKAHLQAAWQAAQAAADRHTITQRLAPASLRSGRHGRPTGSKPFSVPPRLSKAATAFWRNSITISEAYRSGDIKCGPSCITSIVALQMARRRHAWFFRREFPDLFETVLSYVDDLPRPRQRHQLMALSG